MKDLIALVPFAELAVTQGKDTMNSAKGFLPTLKNAIKNPTLFRRHEFMKQFRLITGKEALLDKSVERMLESYNSKDRAEKYVEDLEKDVSVLKLAHQEIERGFKSTEIPEPVQRKEAA